MKRSGSIMQSTTNGEKYYEDALNVFQRHIELYETHKLFRLRDAEICSMFDKIIISDCHNSIPEAYVNWSRELYKEEYRKLNKNTLCLPQFIRYSFYRYMRKIYLFLWRKFKLNQTREKS